LRDGGINMRGLQALRTDGLSQLSSRVHTPLLRDAGFLSNLNCSCLTTHEPFKRCDRAPSFLELTDSLPILPLSAWHDTSRHPSPSYPACRGADPAFDHPPPPLPTPRPQRRLTRCTAPSSAWSSRCRRSRATTSASGSARLSLRCGGGAGQGGLAGMGCVFGSAREDGAGRECLCHLC
jgi:hypothetical protein